MPCCKIKKKINTTLFLTWLYFLSDATSLFVLQFCLDVRGVTLVAWLPSASWFAPHDSLTSMWSSTQSSQKYLEIDWLSSDAISFLTFFCHGYFSWTKKPSHFPGFFSFHFQIDPRHRSICCSAIAEWRMVSNSTVASRPATPNRMSWPPGCFIKYLWWGWNLENNEHMPIFSGGKEKVKWKFSLSTYYLFETYLWSIMNSNYVMVMLWLTMKPSQTIVFQCFFLSPNATFPPRNSRPY